MTELMPAGGEFRSGVHRMAVRVYYEDTDAAGIVYYANWLRFLERGRTEFLRALGITQSSLMRHEAAEWRAFAVRRLEIEYLGPARLDDALVIETSVEEARGASVLMKQRAVCDGMRLVEARVRVACLDVRGRAARLPAQLLTALTQHGDGLSTTGRKSA